MNCEQARDELLLASARERPELRAHLAGCAACATLAGQAGWLDALARPALVRRPPPAVAARALEAALTEARAPRVVEQPLAGRGLALVTYLLAGLVLVLAGGLLGLGPAASLEALTAGLPEAVRLVLASPAVWLVPSPESLARQWLPWVGLIVLVWGLRERVKGAG